MAIMSHDGINSLPNELLIDILHRFPCCPWEAQRDIVSHRQVSRRFYSILDDYSTSYAVNSSRQATKLGEVFRSDPIRAAAATSLYLSINIVLETQAIGWMEWAALVRITRGIHKLDITFEIGENWASSTRVDTAMRNFSMLLYETSELRELKDVSIKYKGTALIPFNWFRYQFFLFSPFVC